MYDTSIQCGTRNDEASPGRSTSERKCTYVKIGTVCSGGEPQHTRSQPMPLSMSLCCVILDSRCSTSKCPEPAEMTMIDLPVLARSCRRVASRWHSESIQKGTARDSEGTPRSLRGHSEVTPRALRGHSEVTPRSLRGHSEGTPRALRGHSEGTHLLLI